MKQTMHPATRLLIWLLLLGLPVACIDPEEVSIRSTLDILIVDGVITDLPEQMLIQLSQAKADQTLGRTSTFPVMKATVSVVVDSTEVVVCSEIRAGAYQLPTGFRGQVGHAYQLRFTLSDGTQYASTQQVMPPVAPVGKVTSRFNANSVFPIIDETYTGGHDLFVDFQDPANERNYYRWDWTLYEPQDWCRSCYEGIYAVNSVTIVSNSMFQSTQQPFENCFYPPVGSSAYSQVRYKSYDYPCRTRCWEIIRNRDDINIFSDQYSNGGLIIRRPVAHIPFYQNQPCVVHLRQRSLTSDAYEYFSLFQQQTQHTGGLADTPPSVPAGNVHTVKNGQEAVVGYFTASSVFIQPHYLDRNDTRGMPPGLFYALNARLPFAEPYPPFDLKFILDGPPRPPTAVCAPVEFRTPDRPAGWPN
ncbi:DUF4249 family protein [Fibrella aestuarina]|nr:DUF4249 family protein [Fibrella aestuarina]